MIHTGIYTVLLAIILLIKRLKAIEFVKYSLSHFYDTHQFNNMWLPIRTYLLLFCCVVSTTFGFDCPIQKYLRRNGFASEPCTVVGSCVLPEVGQPLKIFFIHQSEVVAATVAVLRQTVWHFRQLKPRRRPPSVSSLRRHILLCVFRI